MKDHKNLAQAISGDMKVVPMTLKAANAYVTEHHRHHKPVPGAKFSIGAKVEDRIVGVAIAGRPVSRMLDNGATLEVNRVCTDGHANACSKLYAAVRRAAQAMGYERLITYTLPEEGGASLRASGWKLLGERGGGDWSRPSRKRESDHPKQVKWLWETILG